MMHINDIFLAALVVGFFATIVVIAGSAMMHRYWEHKSSACDYEDGGLLAMHELLGALRDISGADIDTKRVTQL